LGAFGCLQGYGALCGIEWRHGMQILQQLEAENLEPNAILLTSAAAALQQGTYLLLGFIE
jgi:hypothetical protein